METKQIRTANSINDLTTYNEVFNKIIDEKTGFVQYAISGDIEHWKSVSRGLNFILRNAIEDLIEYGICDKDLLDGLAMVYGFQYKLSDLIIDEANR